MPAKKHRTSRSVRSIAGTGGSAFSILSPEFLDALTRTDSASYCPYKGTASYFSIPAGGARSADAAWSYEAPYDAVAGIKDHLAFYPDRVDTIEERS